MRMSTITVFCGSTPGTKPIYRESALALASAMTAQGIDLVYGGGNRGLMGMLADALKKSGRNVTGVLPKAMDIPQVRTKDVESQLVIVDDMHSRKEMMYRLGDGFIALPGGIGTLEELMEIYTWQELGYHRKPIGILNPGGYYDLLLAFLDHASCEGFLRKEYIDALLVDTDPLRLIGKMEAADISLPDKLS